tara:strand:- start:2466 stop:2720 length:255 start_codon:yes stop_codon:yes gene_type:complete
MREPHSLGCHPIDPRCFQHFLAETPKVSVAKVIRYDQNNIRRMNFLSFRSRHGKSKGQKERWKKTRVQGTDPPAHPANGKKNAG